MLAASANRHPVLVQTPLGVLAAGFQPLQTLLLLVTLRLRTATLQTAFPLTSANRQAFLQLFHIFFISF